jgi:uncharacterized protein
VEAAARGLLALGILIPAGQVEPREPEGHAHFLTIWLHITDACNLRCAYCYLPHQPIEMPLETGLRAVEIAVKTAARRGWHKVQIKYAGGEPSLCLERVLQIHAHACSQAAAQGLQLDGVLLTNGTFLSPDMLNRIAGPGLRLMISLDGLGSDHDKQRINPRAQSTAQLVMRNIDLAATVPGLRLNISITVTRQNAASLTETVAWVSERSLPFNLNFFRDNDHVAQAEAMALQFDDDEQIIDGVLRVFDWMEAHPSRNYSLLSMLDRANFFRPHSRVCGAGVNYLVFRPDGQTAACHMSLEQPVAYTGHPDPLSVLENDSGELVNLIATQKEGCATCRWRFACAGGCPLVTQHSTGRFDTRSPYCDIYQALFPRLLQLEGKRLLATRTDLGLSW